MLSIYEKIAYEVFFEIDRCWTVKGGYPAVMEYLKTYDWSRLEILLTFQEKYYLDKDNFSSEDDSYEINAKCDMYRALLSAIKEDQESFDEYMGYLWEDFKREFEKAIEYSHWSRFTEFNDMSFAGSFVGSCVLGEVFHKLDDIVQQKYALPYLISCADLIHNWIKTLPHYTEFEMYNWYKLIAAVAFEVDDATKIWGYYQKKVDEMAEKHYEIKFDDLA